MHDRVDLRGVHDALQDRVTGIGAHVLGALQREDGLVLPEPDDDLDVVTALELLGDPASPEGADAGDECTHADARPQPAQTLVRARNMS